MRCYYISACKEEVSACHKRLCSTGDGRLARRLCALQALMRHDADGQPVVVSAEDLLSAASFRDGVVGLRKSLMVESGLPVAMLEPHPDTERCRYAAGVFFTLNTPGAAARLLAHEHVVRGTAMAATPVAPPGVIADVRRLLRGNFSSADARSAVLLGLLGAKDAARALKVRVGVVQAAADRAHDTANAACSAWEAHLLSECIHDGITDIENATPVIIARARRRFAAALAAPPVHDPLLLFTGAECVFSARLRRALDFVLLNFGRESPHQTVKVGDQHVARIDLSATGEEIWRAYEETLQLHGETGVSRRSFLRHVILPQMKLRNRKTCLCSPCEDGLEAIEALHELQSADERRDAFPCNSSTAEHECLTALRTLVSQLKPELHAYSIRVTAQLEADDLDAVCLTGALSFDAMLAQPVTSLDGMRAAIDAVAQKAATPAALGDWLASARTHVAQLEAYKRLLLGRAWQNVRQKQKLDLLVVKAAAGKRAVVIIVDYKAKQTANTELRERQSDYWDNSSVSIIGFVIIWYEDGSFHRKYRDYVSADTTQDALWTSTAMDEVAKDLAQDGFDEAHFDSDNAYHFHKNYVFSNIVPRFVRAMRLRAFTWQFCEPGEGKDEADGHFGASPDGALAYIVAARSCGVVHLH